MYAHSNEVEELGVISLFGVNVESDPLKESLLGVSVVLFFFFFSFLVKWCSSSDFLRFSFLGGCNFSPQDTHTHTHTHTLEGELVYVVYGIEFVCFSCTTSKGTCIMDD